MQSFLKNWCQLVNPKNCVESEPPISKKFPTFHKVVSETMSVSVTQTLPLEIADHRYIF